MAVLKVGKRSTYKTIFDAHLHAQSGDTIRVSPGIYREALVIGVPGLTIEGAVSSSTASTNGDESNSNNEVVLAPPLDDTEWSAVRIHERGVGVTLRDLTIEGQHQHVSDRDDDWPSAVLVEATNATLINCKVRGQASLGVTVEAPHACLKQCDIRVLKSAVLVAGLTASVSLRECHIESLHDTGVWLEECSRCVLEHTQIVQCGRVGIYVRSAASRLRNVRISHCKPVGISFGMPTAPEFSGQDYVTLATVGHELHKVTVEHSEQHGLETVASVRVHCQESRFLHNGGSGASFFHDDGDLDADANNTQSPHDNGDYKPSLLKNCTFTDNKGYGVQADTRGMVKLLGPSKTVLRNNGLGPIHNVNLPRKRKRKNANEASTANPATNHKRRTESIGAETACTADMTDGYETSWSCFSAATATSGATGATTGTTEIQEDDATFTRQQQQVFDSYRDEIPTAQVMKKAGVPVPDCWPPALIFLGSNNVSGWPPIHELYGWYLTHQVQCNQSVYIKPSRGRGLGCFAARKFRKGAIIGYYTGKLQEQVPTKTSNYIASYCKLPSHILEKQHLEGEWEIDAEYGGNEMRFINYPNKEKGERASVKAESVLQNGLPVIAIRALVTIRKHEELLWDYGTEYFTTVSPQQP